MKNDDINRYQIELDNREISAPKRNVRKEKLRTIIISGISSAVLMIIILITLPLTVLSLSGLFVYSTIVSLVIFLFILLFRYFSILVLAYLYITKFTVEKKNSYYPFISIIVPAYNEGVVIKDSVNSLLNLDYPNYEIIIVNDGSTDNTAEAASALVGNQQGRTSQVKVSLINKPNGGKAKALNAGIQYSEADFILCMDGDSQLTTDTLKNGVRHLLILKLELLQEM